MGIAVGLINENKKQGLQNSIFSIFPQKKKKKSLVTCNESH